MSCIYLKKRKSKPYCNLIKKEISFRCCQQCDDKTYKTKIKDNLFYKTYKTKNQENPFYKSSLNRKSSKLAKLERNRKSVFTDDLKHCYLCGKRKEELHEIFGGCNRINSMKYNLVLPLCHECHFLNQNNPFFNDYWHKQGQEYFECNIGTREDFIRVFRRNYLD